MKACPDRKKTLWLDVYGELDPNDRIAWEKHLEGCEGCRLKRQQLLQLLGKVRAAMTMPDRYGLFQPWQRPVC